MKRTTGQNKRLYQLLTKLGISDDIKTGFVLQYTNGRTERSSEMSVDECNCLITALADEMNKRNRQKGELTQKMRRNIFKLMYDIGKIDNNMSSDEKLKVINRWIEHKLNITTNLNSLNVDELVKLTTQLRAVRRVYGDKQQEYAEQN